MARFFGTLSRYGGPIVTRTGSTNVPIRASVRGRDIGAEIETHALAESSPWGDTDMVHLQVTGGSNGPSNLAQLRAWEDQHGNINVEIEYTAPGVRLTIGERATVTG